MAIGVELPALGESVVEGTVARWLVALGDSVEVDQPLVEVTTDKVDAEVPAPVAGVVSALLVAEGDVVEVGAKLLEIDPHAGVGRTARDSPEPSQPRREEGKSLETVAGSDEPEGPDDIPGQAGPVGSLRATPLARRMAGESGLALEEVEGSGSAGRVTKADVLRHASDEKVSAPPVAPPRASAPRTRRDDYRPEEGDRVIPMSPMRRIIAEHMVYSKHVSPHVGTVAEVDLSAVGAFRSAHKEDFKRDQGFSLTYLPFIVQAVVRALRQFPALNASVLADAIVEKRALNIGLAVETEKGLVVPVIRNADRLSLSGLAAEIDDLSTRARTKRLSVDDLQGGTFTISNPGRRGNLYGFAIINQPQVGILRMGEIVKRPVVTTSAGEDSIAIRPMMHLALSYDHRAVDGAPANGFLYAVREGLEQADFDL
jgi:2-oxoglutarate dehydrogenase E2 component (dihydrolipoamide succinyltransferase)